MYITHEYSLPQLCIYHLLCLFFQFHTMFTILAGISRQIHISCTWVCYIYTYYIICLLCFALLLLIRFGFADLRFFILFYAFIYDHIDTIHCCRLAQNNTYTLMLKALHIRSSQFHLILLPWHLFISNATIRTCLYYCVFNHFTFYARLDINRTSQRYF